MATCDGTRCGVKCPQGQKPCDDKCIAVDAPCAGCPPGKNACNGVCVLATDKTACGPACTPCPSPAHGKSDCDGEQCTLACDSGYHACGNECRANDDPMFCSAACLVCEKPVGGSATCDGSKCGSSCPSGMVICKGRCIAMNAACDGECGEGKHDCAGNCVDNQQPATCGKTACAPCAAPANADATCGAAETCGFTCRTGHHQCQNKCEPNNSPKTCGTSCTPCPVPANGTAACTNGACDTRCNQGFQLCNGACRECCTPSHCPAQTNRTATCSNGTCQYTDNCVANQMCAPDTECQTFRSACVNGVRQCNPVNKGSSTKCGTGANAGTCSNGSCVSACAGVTCSGHGSCSGGTCTCTGGWTGANCQTAPDPCAGNNCSGHGTCSGGTCSCQSGWIGEQCQTAGCQTGTLCGGACRSCNNGCDGSNCRMDIGGGWKWTRGDGQVDSATVSQTGANFSVGFRTITLPGRFTGPKTVHGDFDSITSPGCCDGDVIGPEGGRATEIRWRGNEQWYR